MSSPGEPQGPGAGLAASSELRRSVGQATDRINEIIDAAERVAVEVQRDAEIEAERYLSERKGEADRLAGERTVALDRLTTTLADSAERFKRQAEQMLGELDQVVAEARAGMQRDEIAAVATDPAPDPGAAVDAKLAPEPEAAFELDPAPEPEPALHPVAESYPATGFEPERAPEPEPQPAAPHVVTWTEPAPAGSPAEIGDETTEALLRATQMAVTGKGRDEIAKALRADFPSVDADSIVDEILA